MILTAPKIIKPEEKVLLKIRTPESVRSFAKIPPPINSIAIMPKLRIGR